MHRIDRLPRRMLHEAGHPGEQPRHAEPGDHADDHPDVEERVVRRCRFHRRSCPGRSVVHRPPGGQYCTETEGDSRREARNPADRPDAAARRGGARRSLRRPPLLGGRGPRRAPRRGRPARSAPWRPTATTAFAPEVMAAPAGARDRRELRRRLRRDRHRRLQGPRRPRHEHARRPQRRGRRARHRPDDRALPPHPAGRRPCARAGRWPQRRLRPDRRAHRRPCRHPRPRPDRQGDRPPPAGDEDARLLPRPPRAALRALRLTTPTSTRWRATSTGWW